MLEYNLAAPLSTKYASATLKYAGWQLKLYWWPEFGLKHAVQEGKRGG